MAKKWTTKEICDNFIPEHQIYPSLSENEEFIKISDIEEWLRKERHTPADQVWMETQDSRKYHNADGSTDESKLINDVFDFPLNDLGNFIKKLR
jgi:hypothetical protein